MTKSRPTPAPDRLSSAEEQLAVVEQSGLVGTWLWDFSTGRVVWSKGLYRLIGLDPAVVAPSTSVWQSLLHPDDVRDITDPQVAFAKPGWGERTVRLLRPDGVMRHIRSVSELTYNRDGSFRAVRGASFDVTESEELRADMRRAMELLDLIRDVAGVRTWDPVVDTVEFSPTWTSASDRDQIVAAWRAAQSSEKAFSVQHKGPSDRGHHVTHARPYRNARGRVEGWVGVVVPNHEPAVDDLAPPAWAIRAARAALGWTTQELAERAGVSFSTIRRAETESQAGSVRRASRGAIATALRRAGVRFPAQDGQIAVSLLPPGETP